MPKTAKKRLTLVDVARHAKVSPMAVSHVLFGTGQGVIRVGAKTATRIRRCADDLGYVPNRAAQMLAGKKSGIVGIIANDWLFPNEMRVMAWVQHWADHYGFRVLASQANRMLDPIKEYVADFASRGIDGLLFLAYGNDDLWPHLQEVLKPIPHVIALFGQPSLENGCCIDSDYAQGAAQAVKYLYGKGRKKIVQVLEDIDSRANRERWRGFVEAHRELGREVTDDQLCIATKNWYPDNEGFAGLVDDFVRQRKADAIAADSDLGAVGFLKVMRRQGIRVPEDIAVMGWGNENPAAWYDPPITTVNLRVREAVGEAMGLLATLAREKGGTLPSLQLIPPELLIRETA